MRAALSTLEVVRPKSLDQALREMRDATERIVPMAGGTDLFVYLNAGSLNERRFLDLQALRELRGVKVAASGARLGALTTFREIREHEELRRAYPALTAAAAEVGAWQIQNRATIAGNIANASPAGDSLPTLMIYDARVVVRSARGTRVIPFERLYRGYRDLDLQRDELITAVELPALPALSQSFFRKVGTRRAQSISKMVFAGLVARDRAGRVSHVRLAFGSVAPVPIRARQAESALLGEPLSAASVRHAVSSLARDVVPIDDIRSTREYRLEVAANVLTQFLGSIAAGKGRG